MKMLGRFNFTSARYSILYLPAFSYGYLYLEQGDISFLYFEVSAIWLSAITLVGAIVMNSVLRAVYGIRGPEERPKKQYVVIYYYAGLFTSPNPPKYDNKKTLPENIRGLIGWNMASLRFAFVFLILLAYFILIWLSVGFLFLHIQGGSGERVYLGGALLILQTIFLLRSPLDICPAAPPSDAVEYIDTPEYIRWKEDLSEHEENSSSTQSNLEDF
jgi:hypothetical protein